MDYFQNQDVAKKRTGMLVFFFGLAVLLIILSVYLAIAAVLSVAEPAGPGETISSPASLWNPELFGMVAAGNVGTDRRGQSVQDGRTGRRRPYGGRTAGRAAASPRPVPAPTSAGF